MSRSTPSLRIIIGSAAMLCATMAVAETKKPATSNATATTRTTTQTTARAQATTRPTKPATRARKVWTEEDLRRLRQNSRAAVNYIAIPTADLPIPTYAAPTGVENRYREMLAESDREIARLDKELQAARNPFLRGTAPPRDGERTGPRPQEEVMAELNRWKARRAAAVDAIRRAEEKAAANAVTTAPVIKPEQ